MSCLMCFEWFRWALCAGTLIHMYPLPPPSPSIMYNPHLSYRCYPHLFAIDVQEKGLSGRKYLPYRRKYVNTHFAMNLFYWF